MMVRAIGVTDFDGRPHEVEIDTPTPGAGEVRVAVHTATVNPADVLFWSGGVAAALTASRPPYVAGLELAGTIEALGPGVSGWKRGETIAAITRFIPEGRGAHTKSVVVSAASLMRIPEGTGLAEAATIPMNGLTALRALDLLDLPAGATLVVTGAAGALGGYLVELGAARGLRVIGVSSASDEDLLLGLGAARFIARGDDVPAAIVEATNGGADAVVDAALVGESMYDALRPGGTFLAVRPPDPTPRDGIRCLRVTVSDYTGVDAASRRLERLWAEGVLTPRVARVLSPTEIDRARSLVANGGQRGRIVLDFARW